MALTIKKSKLTLKAPVAETPVPEGGEAPVDGSEALAVDDGAPEAASGSGISVFQIVVLVFAIIACVLYAALLGIQLKESADYDAPPKAFPDFVPSMVAAPAPAPAPEPPPPAPEPVPTTSTVEAASAPAAAGDAAAPAATPAAAEPAAAAPPPEAKPEAKPAAKPSDIPAGV